MSTHNLLEQAVIVAGTEIRPQLGTIKDIVTELENLDPDLRTDQEKALFKLVKAINTSLPLINLASAITAGGVGSDGFPRLAVASYDMSFRQQDVRVRVDVEGSLWFRGRFRDWHVSFPDGTLPPVTNIFKKMWYPIEAIDTPPIVPPLLRQANSTNVVLLYEVANWKRVVRAPLDPYLLRQVAGNVYAILGTWDITERELRAYQAARDLNI
jgi:hypothetical protein